MEINKNDSATGWAPSERSYQNTGLTVRAQIAAMCLQGLLSKQGFNNPGYVANEAVACADALIEQLNNTSEDGTV